MKNKILTALVILKISILATWLTSAILPYSSKVALAGLPPQSDSAPEVEKEQSAAPEKGFIQALKRKEAELRTREDELAEKKRHLLDIRSDIDMRAAELKTLVKELNTLKEKIDSFNNGKARRLVKIYENMEPQSAAARLERLDDAMAASILGSMKEKIAGKILGFVNVDKSVRISRVMKKEVR